MFATKEDEKFLSSVERTIKKSIPVVVLDLGASSETREERAPRAAHKSEQKQDRAPAPRAQEREQAVKRPRPARSHETADEVVTDGPGFGNDIPAFLR